MLGARRTVLAVASPGGDAVAYVFEARCAQGLCQSLWIGKDMRHAAMAQMLAGPSEQAGEIAWTPDASRVAFIVNGYQLRLFDAPDRRQPRRRVASSIPTASRRAASPAA